MSALEGSRPETEGNKYRAEKRGREEERRGRKAPREKEEEEEEERAVWESEKGEEAPLFWIPAVAVLPLPFKIAINLDTW